MLISPFWALGHRRFLAASHAAILVFAPSDFHDQHPTYHICCWTLRYPRSSLKRYTPRDIKFLQRACIWAALLALSTFIFPYERASLRPKYSLCRWSLGSFKSGKRSLYYLCFRFSHAGHSPKPFSNDHASGLLSLRFLLISRKTTSGIPKFLGHPNLPLLALPFLISFTPSDILFCFSSDFRISQWRHLLCISYMFLFLYCRFLFVCFQKPGRQVANFEARRYGIRSGRRSVLRKAPYSWRLLTCC